MERKTLLDLKTYMLTYVDLPVLICRNNCRIARLPNDMLRGHLSPHRPRGWIEFGMRLFSRRSSGEKPLS